MKRMILVLTAFVTLFATSPLQANAATEVKNEQVVAANSLTQADADAMVTRLHEIHKMDKSNLTKSEKQELRSEVIQIKNQLENNPVIVISGTTLLLIIIILILL